MNIYGIYDLKAGYFLPVLEASTDEHAERIVADAIEAGNKMLATHQNDFLLYCLAQYDNKDGMITQDHKPDLVISIPDLIKKYFTPPAQQADLYQDATVDEMLEEKKSMEDTPIPDDS